MTERKKATAVMEPRYQRASKKAKGKILDEFVALTGYRRSYASCVLSSHGTRRRIGTHRVIVADVRQQGREGGQRYTGKTSERLVVLVRI